MTSNTLLGEAQVMMAQFSRRHALTPRQRLALASEIYFWAGHGLGIGRVSPTGRQPLTGFLGRLRRGLADRGVLTPCGITQGWQPEALADLWAIAQAQARAEGLRPLEGLT